MHAQEFFCNDCDRPFFITVKDDEVEEGSTACPYCGSQDVDECLIAGYPAAARKAA